MDVNKPNNPKCNTCFVVSNILRCWNCKYKTKEWEYKNIGRIIMRGEKDLYKPKAENEEDKELIVNKDVYDTLTEEQKKFVDIGLSYFNNRKC